MKKLNLLFTLFLLTAASAKADVAAETYSVNTLDELPERALLVNTFNDRALVFDADNQTMLGMISFGIGANAVEIDRANDSIYVAENYFSRHTRGTRTDVVSTYSISNLAPVAEVEIPPKHASGSPMRNYSGVITDGDTRLMLVVNITPAVSISVVDLDAQKFLAEVSTAGCGLVYPTEGLSFMQICGDGTMQLITLNADGTEKSRTRSNVFFNLEDDPLMEKGVQTRDGSWLFNTFNGIFYSVSIEGGKPVATQAFDINTLQDGWKIGGIQPIAYHAGSNLVLTLMHQDEGKDEPLHQTHKDPGTEVWYVDLTEKRLKHRLKFDSSVYSIQVSQDDTPLLYAGSVSSSQVEIYDLKTTALLGSLTAAGLPTILQNL